MAEWGTPKTADVARAPESGVRIRGLEIVGADLLAESTPPERLQGRVFLFDSNGLNPYGFAVAKALDDSGLRTRYAHRNAGVVRSLGAPFGPPQGGISRGLRRLARAVWLCGSLVRACFRMREASIAHFLWESPSDALLALAVRVVLRKRVVATIHDPTRPGAVARAVRWVLVRSGDRVVMHSEALACGLLADDHALQRSRLLVIPLPSYVSLVRSGRSASDARRGLGLDLEAELVLFFGQLRPDKGLPTFATACRLLLKERPKLKVVVAGAGGSPSLEADLKAQLDVSGGRYYRFGGSEPVSEATFLSLIEAADLVVLPLERASQSSSSVLALSCGRPLVTTAVGENVALARAGAAAIVPPGDPVALADVCSALLDSPDARNGLAARGEAYAREALSPVRHASALMAQYAELVSDA